MRGRLLLCAAVVGAVRPAAFRANKVVNSQVLQAQSKSPDQFLTTPESVRALFSQADDVTQLDQNTWKLTTYIEFPSMVARSLSSVMVSTLPTGELRLEVFETSTEVETGPPFARKLMEAISSRVRTTSVSKVSVQPLDSGEEFMFISEASMAVEMQLPVWLPIPKARLEEEGSKSMQSALDAQMEPIMQELGRQYLSWSSSHSSVGSSAQG